MRPRWLKYCLIVAGATICPSLAQAAEDSPAPDGDAIFQDYCSVCHGEFGNGRSRAMGGLIPPPSDFTSDASARDLTRERMIFSVTYGRANTAMTSWQKRLSTEEISAVIDHVRTFFMGIDDTAEPAQANLENNRFDPQYMAQAMPYGLEGIPAWGKLFYADNCASCHGDKGNGKGPRSYFIMPKPRNFHHPAAQHELNRPSLFKAISEGSLHSEMPAWDKVLTHQEIAHVTAYVFDTFIEKKTATSGPAATARATPPGG